MMSRMTQKLRDAMRAYYEHRKAQRENGWDKQADLRAISKVCPKTVTYMEASAGTFLLWWKDGVQTVHDERNYWQEVVFTRTRGDVCRKYRDITGKKLPRSEVVTR